jgi:DNA-binding transcriptional regulator YiaG
VKHKAKYAYAGSAYSFGDRQALRAIKLKSIYRAENLEACAQLRAVREAAGLTQTELASRFDRLQSFVSTVERGLVRLDIVQIREWCLACRTTLPLFAQALEMRIVALEPSRAQARKPRNAKKK